MQTPDRRGAAFSRDVCGIDQGSCYCYQAILFRIVAEPMDSALAAALPAVRFRGQRESIPALR